MRIKKKHILIGGSLALLGAIAFATVLMNGPRMRHQSSLHTYEFEMRLPAEDAIEFAHGSEESKFMYIPAVSHENLQKAAAYYEYYCIFCHGDDGKGNGPVGESYFPKPADITTNSLSQLNATELYTRTFNGAGHAPVLEKVVPAKHKPYLLLCIKEGYFVDEKPESEHSNTME